MQKFFVAGVILSAFSCASGFAQTSLARVATRLAAQNALFEEQYEAGLKMSPERATAYGDYRYNDKLSEASLASITNREITNEGYLARLKAILTDGFAEQDVLSHELMVRSLEQGMANYKLKEYEMQVSQMDGPHTGLADLPLAVPLDSVKHYEDYLARLHQIPRVFTQTEEVLRQGEKDNLMPVKFLLEKVPGQCSGVIAADPFLIPLKKFPASFSDADKTRLTKDITDAVNNEVLPAYKQFSEFIATEYAPHGRTTLSVASLPGGEARYINDIRARTTVSDKTPDEIHQLGLREIDRIEADMLVIAKKEGFC